MRINFQDGGIGMVIASRRLEFKNRLLDARLRESTSRDLVSGHSIRLSEIRKTTRNRFGFTAVNNRQRFGRVRLFHFSLTSRYEQRYRCA
jgi:hypothetical protein